MGLDSHDFLNALKERILEQATIERLSAGKRDPRKTWLVCLEQEIEALMAIRREADSRITDVSRRLWAFRDRHGMDQRDR